MKKLVALGDELFHQYYRGWMTALTKKEKILLLRSVLLRGKAGGKYAEVAEKIKQLLML